MQIMTVMISYSDKKDKALKHIISTLLKLDLTIISINLLNKDFISHF